MNKVLSVIGLICGWFCLLVFLFFFPAAVIAFYFYTYFPVFWLCVAWMGIYIIVGTILLGVCRRRVTVGKNNPYHHNGRGDNEAGGGGGNQMQVENAHAAKITPRRTYWFIFAVGLLNIIALGFWINAAFPSRWEKFENTQLQAVGSVTDTSAKIWGRLLASNDMLVYIRLASDTSLPFALVGIASLSSSTDYTAVYEVTGLQPATEYQYQVRSTNDAFSFPASTFRTFPSIPSSNSFSFVFGSCFFRRPWEELTNFKLITKLSPSFYMFLGDLIYSDSPVYLSKTVEYFYTYYRRMFDDKYFQSILSTLPSFFIFSDHELDDGWDERTELQYDNAINKAWNNYVAVRNPTPPIAGGGVYYYSYNYGDVSFFVMDTRTYRARNSLDNNSPDKDMVGSTQMEEIKEFLREGLDPLSSIPLPRVKFLVCEIPFTLNDNRGDSWSGHMHERTIMFDYITDLMDATENGTLSGPLRVVFLSGDMHIAASFEMNHKGRRFYEFSASPVQAFSIRLGGSSGSFLRNRADDKTLHTYSGTSVLGHMSVDTTTTVPSVKHTMYRYDGDVLWTVDVQFDS